MRDNFDFFHSTRFFNNVLIEAEKHDENWFILATFIIW